MNEIIFTLLGLPIGAAGMWVLTALAPSVNRPATARVLSAADVSGELERAREADHLFLEQERRTIEAASAQSLAQALGIAVDASDPMASLEAFLAASKSENSAEPAEPAEPTGPAKLHLDIDPNAPWRRNVRVQPHNVMGLLAREVDLVETMMQSLDEAMVGLWLMREKSIERLPEDAQQWWNERTSMYGRLAQRLSKQLEQDGDDRIVRALGSSLARTTRENVVWAHAVGLGLMEPVSRKLERGETEAVLAKMPLSLATSMTRLSIIAAVLERP